MADVANSTPAPAVHPLTGSTLPGAGILDRLHASQEGERSPTPNATDVAAQRAAVMRLAKLHGLDAEVIELAERTEALALRERSLWERRAHIDDAVTRALPSRPVRPAMQSRMQHAEATVDGARTFSITEPPEWRVEHQAVEAAHAAAVAEHERLESETGIRLGLPIVDKLAGRASRRLSRWSRRLAALPPRTYAGLRAKAAVLRATVEDGQLYDTWRQVLAVSVGADAIRLIEAEAEDRFNEDQARDGQRELATGHVCTTEEAAELPFEPWSGECWVPSNSDWPRFGSVHLPYARMAWMINTKTKEDLMSSLAEMDASDGTFVQKLWDDIKDTADAFKALHDLTETAWTRMMVALSAMMLDPRYKHLFKNAPDAHGSATEAA